MVGRLQLATVIGIINSLRIIRLTTVVLLIAYQLIEEKEKCVHANYFCVLVLLKTRTLGNNCNWSVSSRALHLPSILTTRPVALVLVELRHAVCRQWAEHVVLDESRLDLYSLSPMSMYRTMIRVHGARKKSTDDSSNAYGSLLARPHVDNSCMVMPLWSCPYTSPIWMALGIEGKTEKREKLKIRTLKKQ